MNEQPIPEEELAEIEVELFRNSTSSRTTLEDFVSRMGKLSSGFILRE
jgi:hypothetical protein